MTDVPPSIPRCTSTQHLDNTTVPFFTQSPALAGEDEIREAFYAYSHLGCDEQMWDVEGKEIDTYVVRKLLSFYEDYFRKHTLGEELRLTLRVPNPTVETADAKVLLERLESIPRSYDAALEIEKATHEFVYAATFLPEWTYAPSAGMRWLMRERP